MLDRTPRLTLSERHAEWLEEERRIPCEIAAQAGLVSRGSHLAFSYVRHGELQFLKVRREVNEEGERSKTFHIEPKGEKLFMWNIDCLTEPLPSEDTPLIVTEGEFDALSFMAIGAPFVVSVPNGSPLDKPGEGNINPLEDNAFAYLWEDGRLVKGLEKFRRIILATDADRRGRVLRDELAVRLGRNRCWVIDFPEGCKDANEVLQKHGEEALTDALAAARPLVPSKLVPFGDIPEANKTPLSLGWHGMDKFCRVLIPELMILTGPPGAGKSQLALGIGANLAWHHGLKGAILQFEDDVDRHRGDLMRFATTMLGGGVGNDPHGAPVRVPRSKASAWIDRMFLTMSPSEELEDTAFDLAWLDRTIEEAATRHGCKWLLIDPWNEIEHMFGRGFTEAQYLNDALRRLKRAMRRYQILIMVVAHPDKSGQRKDSIADLTLSDISGGAAWRNKADHGLIVYAPDARDSLRHVKIDKSKNFRLMGTPGTVRLRFKQAWGVWEFDSEEAMSP